MNTKTAVLGASFACLSALPCCLAANELPACVAQPNAVSIADHVDVAATEQALAKAIAEVNVAAVVQAVENLERAGARVRILPYLQRIPEVTASLAASCCLFAILTGATVFCGEGARLIQRGNESLKPTFWRWQDEAKELAPEDVTPPLARPVTFRRGDRYQSSGWLDQNLVHIAFLAVSAAVCACGVKSLEGIIRLQTRRSREIAGILLTSPALIVGEDQEKIAAILKKLGVVTLAKAELKA